MPTCCGNGPSSNKVAWASRKSHRYWSVFLPTQKMFFFSNSSDNSLTGETLRDAKRLPKLPRRIIHLQQRLPAQVISSDGQSPQQLLRTNLQPIKPSGNSFERDGTFPKTARFHPALCFNSVLTRAQVDKRETVSESLKRSCAHFIQAPQETRVFLRLFQVQNISDIHYSSRRHIKN